MITRILAGTVLAGAVAAGSVACAHSAPTTPIPTAPPSGTVHVINVSDHGLTYTVDCGHGSVIIKIVPDNPATRADAAPICGQYE